MGIFKRECMELKIGNSYNTNQGDIAVIISHGSKKRYYNCKFLHPNTPSNFIREYRQDHILSGNIKNPFYPNMFGIGFLGNSETLQIQKTKAYPVWKGVMERGYSSDLKEKFPTYDGVYVCDEWHNFSNFEIWFNENYIEGYELDKDVLVKGNKVYSPETCAFIPSELNKVLTRSNGSRGQYPLGVNWHKHLQKFASTVRYNNKSVHIGYYDTPEEAFYAYKVKKEEIIKEYAEKYFKDGLITEEVYNSLLTYEVSIDD